jgi:hypothetical protein
MFIVNFGPWLSMIAPWTLPKFCGNVKGRLVIDPAKNNLPELSRAFLLSLMFRLVPSRCSASQTFHILPTGSKGEDADSGLELYLG